MPVLVTFIFANRANTSTSISPMPILVLVFSQCPYRYWHPFSNNASSGSEHVRYQYRHFDIVNTNTVIIVMPVLVLLISANCANTSTGIFFIPILVLMLSFTMPIPVWSYISWPFWSFVTTFLDLSPPWQTRSDVPVPRHGQIIWQVEQNESEYSFVLKKINHWVWVFICTKLNQPPHWFPTQY